jgi:hypothetical protein
VRSFKNAGFTTDFSFFSLMAMLSATNQVYYIPVRCALPPTTHQPAL